MRLPILFLLMTSLLIGTLGFAQSPDGPFILVPAWKTVPVLKVPESVCYDPTAGVLYVSNINGKPTEKNGQGFISKLSAEGEILTLQWATGLNAPKGMAIHDGKLYVSDIDRLVSIDLANGKIVQTFPAAGGQFLNDVAVDEEGRVYVSDMSDKNSVIYRLEAGKLTVWLQGPEIKSPNGLFYHAGVLYIGNSGDGKIKAVEVASKKITTVAEVGSGIDGLIRDKAGFFLVSDWRGKTSLVTQEGRLFVLLDTTDQNVNSADLGYIPDKRLVLIPTFFDNRVAAYRLVEK